MPVIAGMTYDFVSSPRVGNIPDAAGDVTVEDLWDTLSEEAAKVENLDKKKFINRPLGGGRASLSPTKDTGITLPLDNMVLKFPDQPGPTYVIKRVIDGNLIAIDSGGSPIEPLASSDFTNWKNEADVSAALVQAGTVESNAFSAGSVFVDGDVGSPGTAFPLGTPTNPVDNIDDAVTIANARNLRTICLLTQNPFYTPTQAMSSFNINSIAPLQGGVPSYDPNGQVHLNTKLQGLNLSGDYGIGSFVRVAKCSLQPGTNVVGDFHACDILNEQALPSSAFPSIIYENCTWKEVLSPNASINFGGSTNGIVRIFGGSGQFAVRNMAHSGHTLLVEGFSGKIVLEATCTAGTITVRGDIDVEDSSAGTTVSKTGSTRIQILKKLLTRNFWLGNR